MFVLFGYKHVGDEMGQIYEQICHTKEPWSSFCFAYSEIECWTR